MARRTHELVFNEDTPDRYVRNRLGFEYSEGKNYVTLLHPDSQNSEQEHTLTRAEVVALRNFAEMVLEHIDGGLPE